MGHWDRVRKYLEIRGLETRLARLVGWEIGGSNADWNVRGDLHVEADRHTWMSPDGKSYQSLPEFHSNQYYLHAYLPRQTVVVITYDMEKSGWRWQCSLDHKIHEFGRTEGEARIRALIAWYEKEREDECQNNSQEEE